MKWRGAIFRILLALGVFFLAAGLSPPDCQAAARKEVSKGQTVYIPIYSHIYSGDRERPVNLTATLSIRNTDPVGSITIVAVNYHDSEGNPVTAYINEPVRLKPLASVRFIVKESDTRGGSGACFLVKWNAAKPASAPLMEGIMISTRSQQGISFVSRGQVVEEIH